ncbi:bifunctional lysylphosphatidylglycerol flippase/synthetase MprF [Kitasatospora indigofera]|uniref:bifunctional lysylphosphatidylglycerol flippase/synthetase MprF n=1 Tax=Kitasatospora indigofera TaxID=67307 RepID=UPI003683CA9C
MTATMENADGARSRQASQERSSREEEPPRPAPEQPSPEQSAQQPARKQSSQPRSGKQQTAQQQTSQEQQTSPKQPASQKQAGQQPKQQKQPPGKKAGAPPEAAPAGAARLRGRAVALVTRLPFTCGVCVAVLLVALASGTLWSSAEDKSWYPQVAYGTPSLTAGRLWTFVTGAFFASDPVVYLLVVIGLALLVGYTEWRLGTARAALVCCAGQLAATLGCAALLLALRQSGWDWAEALSHDLDTGFSAGALAAAAAATAAMRAPWRSRLRAALIAFAVIWLLYSGTVSDVEHFLAVVLGLAVGRRLAGDRAAGTGPPSRREWRLGAVTGLVIVAVTQIVVWLAPGYGPLGDTHGLSDSHLGLAVSLVVIALLVNGLRRGSRLAWRWTVGFAVLNVLVGLLAAVVLVLSVTTDADVEVTGLPVLLPQAVVWTMELVLLIGARDAFRAPSRRKRRKAAAKGGLDRAGATELLKRYGGSNLSWMTTWRDNSYLSAADGRAYVAYRTHARVAVALGDPVGRPEDRDRALTEFAGMCDASGVVPCLFSASERTAVAAERMGWQHVQVAEDTVIELEGLEFRGKSWQDVRTALNRAKKEGMEYRLGALADEPAKVVAQVRAISEEWVSDMGLPEMGFTLGGVEEALDRNVRVGLAIDPDGQVHGVTSWMPVYGEGGTPVGWTLDVMRRRKQGAFRPVVEFLIASTCLAVREDGATFLSLSGAPLARGASTADSPLERFLDQLGAALEPYYGFRSLHSFKAKFQPVHEPMHLVYRDEADLPRIGVALTRAYMPQAGLRDFGRMLVPAGEH